MHHSAIVSREQAGVSLPCVLVDWCFPIGRFVLTPQTNQAPGSYCHAANKARSTSHKPGITQLIQHTSHKVNSSDGGGGESEGQMLQHNHL